MNKLIQIELSQEQYEMLEKDVKRLNTTTQFDVTIQEMAKVYFNLGVYTELKYCR